MPGRVSARISTSSRVSRKSTAPNSTRTSAASRLSGPITEVLNEGPDSVLRTKISTIFSDAQNSATAHRKLAASLRKIQEACCYEPPNRTGKGANEFTEDDFNAEVARCVVQIVPVKKSEGTADRVIRFLGQFLRHANEKDAALVPEQELEDERMLPDTPTARLTGYILSILIALLDAKEKTVRYRSSQIISHFVNILDALDDEYYLLIKSAFLKRVRDKEASVRVQAALGLTRLVGNEGDEEEDDADEEDTANLLERLLSILQNDPSAEVRRTLLLNLPLAPSTLPYLLERARDQDAATRRALYSRLLPALGDFRHLSLSMREKLLRWGLRDRDEVVRKATARLFRERWIEDCAGARGSGEEASKSLSPPNIDALLELLERIDVVTSGMENGIALEALTNFWEGRPDYIAAFTLDDAFWDKLTSESAFLARSLHHFCRQSNDSRYESTLEEKMPEVTKLAFYIQRYRDNLIGHLQRLSLIKDAEADEETVEVEFIVEQLLHIALSLDYSDEVGRRKMFAMLRETLALPELPEEITKLVIEILRLIAGGDVAGEREFCGVVLEAVAEVHDTIASEPSMTEDGDESFHSAKSEVTDTTPTKARPSKKLLLEDPEQDEAKAIKEIVVNMKCLHIAKCMLENVEGTLKQNAHLVTMLNNLVVPAVRSHEAPIRERGLICLGLCCLLDKSLADENLVLFLHCFTKGHTALQVTALHIIADILTTHKSILTTGPSADEVAPNGGTISKQVIKAFSKGIKMVSSPEVQSATILAVCKLMLLHVLPAAICTTTTAATTTTTATTTEDADNTSGGDGAAAFDDLLRQLVTTFFDPATRDNAAARQALAYFLPAYAHSRRDNMEALARVASAVVHSVLMLDEEFDEDEDAAGDAKGSVGLTAVGNMLVDWTDARKLVVLEDDGAVARWDESGKKDREAAPPINTDPHLILAEGLLERALGHGCSKEEKKALVAVLGKLYLSPSCDPERLRVVNELATEASEARLDATSRSALNKLQTALSKVMGGGNGGSEGRASRSRSAETRDETRIVGVEEEEVKAGNDSDEDEDDKAQALVEKEDNKKATSDSVLDDLLEEEDDDR